MLARSRAGAASLQSHCSQGLQSRTGALFPVTCHSLGRPARERVPSGMGRSAFHSRAALLPWHRAAGLSRGGRLPHGLSRRSPHEIVPEVLAPDIVRRFAYQRSSHGRAVGSEAATQTDDTSVEPAEALCALTPRARLTTPRDALRPLGAPPMRTRRAAESVRDWLTRSTHPPPASGRAGLPS